MMSSAEPILREDLHLVSAYREPETPTERRLAELWKEQFNMDRVGVDDRFEDLGGDSLLAINILMIAAQSYSIKIPSTVFVEADTIAKLSRRIDAIRGTSDAI